MLLKTDLSNASYTKVKTSQYGHQRNRPLCPRHNVCTEEKRGGAFYTSSPEKVGGEGGLIREGGGGLIEDVRYFSVPVIITYYTQLATPIFR